MLIKKESKKLLSLSENAEDFCATSATDALHSTHTILHGNFFRVLDCYLLLALHATSFSHQNPLLRVL
jgi:hypothetical protein